MSACGGADSSVWTSGKPQTFKSPEAEIEEVLTGATIEGVRRVGKTIVVTLTGGSGGTEKQIPPLRYGMTNEKEDRTGGRSFWCIWG